MSHWLAKIGDLGPVILAFTNIGLLWNNPRVRILWTYLFFTVINYAVNVLLKEYIQQLRPSLTKKRLKQKNNIYGMPSEHTQNVVFSTVFNYLVYRDIPMTIGFLVISLITMIQRVAYNRHTVWQVIVGSFVGATLGYIAYLSLRQSIMYVK